MNRFFKIEDFKRPSSEFKPAPFWSWNDDLDEKELLWQIREMKKKGWGGFFMHSRVGLITPYLSDKWHSLIKFCANIAKKEGLFAWLYDEDKWPSGFAGGLVPQSDKRFRHKYLVITKDFIDNENEVKLITFLWEDIEWTICVRTEPLEDLWFNGTSYVDLLNPEVTDKFLDITIGSYKNKCGDSFGKEIPGIFTDEPTYCRQEWNGKYNRLPWTDILPSVFKERRGYDLIEKLPELFFETGSFKKTRFDFFLTATELFIENFTKRYFERCEDNSLIFTGHFMAEDSLESQTQWIGAAMPHYEFQHWPGIDKLGRNTEQTLTCKQVSSVADQLNKERVLCETFGCSGQHFDFKKRMWIYNWLASLGINFLNHHLSLYTMAGERKRDYPPNLFYQQPWWNWEKSVSDYFSRLNYCLTRGKRELDILVLHPIGTVWATYNPLSNSMNENNPCRKYDLLFQELIKSLLSRRYDFHLGDEIIMSKYGDSVETFIKIGSHSYKIVIVPPSLTWRKKTFDLLKKFHDKGGKLIFYGEVPSFVEMSEKVNYKNEFPNASFFSNYEELYDFLKKYPRIEIEDIDLKIDVSSVYVHIRKLEDKKRLVFLTNISEKKIINSKITLPWNGKVEKLDCINGKKTEIELNEDSSFYHTFYPGDGLLLLITEDKLSKKEKVKLLDKKKSIVSLEKWNIKPLDLNILPVEKVTLFKEEECVAKEKPVFTLWDEFYSWKDKTFFRAIYTFVIKKIPQNPQLEVIIERPFNLDFVFLNDRPLKLSKKRWNNDPSFVVLDITSYVKQGLNKLEIGGKKINNITGPGTHRKVKDSELPFRPTELENIMIRGNFSVIDFDKKEFVIDNFKNPNSIQDLTSQGFPFYAGKFLFSSNLVIKKEFIKAELVLQDVRFPCVEVYVNNKKAGTLFSEPYIFDIKRLLKKGINNIKLITSTDLFNLTGPNFEPLGEPEFTGPWTFRDTNNFSCRKYLRSYGIGKIFLKFEDI